MVVIFGQIFGVIFSASDFREHGFIVFYYSTLKPPTIRQIHKKNSCKKIRNHKKL
jgi:hypothetical protein